MPFPVVRSRVLVLVLLAATLAAVLAVSADSCLAHRGSAPEAWLAPAIDKLRPDAVAAAAPSPLVVAARGERRAFQVAVRVPGETAVRVRLDRWRGPSRLGRPALFRELTVPVERVAGNRPASFAGAWPDVAARVGGARPVRLAAGTTAFWVETAVPRDAQPGSYTLDVTVGARGRGERSLTATMTVSAARPARLLRSLTHVSNADPPNLVQAAVLDRYGMRTTNWVDDPGALRRLMRLQSVVSLPGQTDPARHRASLRSAMRTLASLGLASRNVAYVADEPDCGELGRVEAAAAAARAADPRIRPLVTVSPSACGGRARRELRSVRIFVPTERDARGEPGVEQWIYPNNARAGYGYVTLGIDDPGPANLLVAWRAAALGADGVLYWYADLWARGSDPFRQAWNEGIGQEYNGDGVLVYPGNRPSLRLLLYHEGALDFDLARCAGAAGRRIARSVVPRTQTLAGARAILAARARLAAACARRSG